jgi:hypothetical protein
VSEAKSGKLVGTRRIQAGEGYGRCSPAEGHFGLGRSPAARYAVAVTFPGGRSVTVQAQPGRQVAVGEPGSR